MIIECCCGAAAVELSDLPRAQFFCHCDDCQSVHCAAYVPVALYSAAAIAIVRGELGTWRRRTTPRRTCVTCGTRMFAEPNDRMRGVTAYLLPPGTFDPTFHINCDFALLPVRDALPHYRRLPALMGGTDDTVSW